MRMNRLGYSLLTANRLKEAIEIFRINVTAFPESFNVYDSLGEGYMKSGQKELAIQNYEKSLQLNPKNANAAAKLKELRGQ